MATFLRTLSCQYQLVIFLWLFEKETAWKLLKNNLRQNLTKQGFDVLTQNLYAGGSLQVIQAQKQNLAI